MVWIDWEAFTETWLQRAKRGQVSVDDGDRFISLWIAFNGWMKATFGERKRDEELLDSTKNLTEFSDVFNTLKQDNHDFRTNLNKLDSFTVGDMRYPNNNSKNKTYDGTFKSLIDVLYQVRCNLFHGRKGTDGKDFELVRLSLKILQPLFESYLSKYHSSIQVL